MYLFLTNLLRKFRENIYNFYKNTSIKAAKYYIKIYILKKRILDDNKTTCNSYYNTKISTQFYC